jgi:hypothetical protein
MTARNVCIDAVTAELRAVGVTYEIAHGGKHPQVHFSINGMRRFYVVPRTPSDWRAAQNARAGVRRLLRKDQLLAREHTTRANGIAAQAKKKSPPPNFETPF